MASRGPRRASTGAGVANERHAGGVPMTTELANASTGPVQAAVAVKDLEIQIGATRTSVVSDVSFEIGPGEILGVVGESGSGKTTVGLALLGHARRGLAIAGGSVLLSGRDVLALND